jgi:ABC-2 type transport system permease protein
VFVRNAGLIIAGLAIFLVLIPFSTAGIPGDSIFEIATTHDQMKFRFIKEDFVQAVFWASVIYGMVSGLMTFSFLLEKRQTTLYFSLGLRRGRLLLSRLLAGICGALAVSLVPLLVSALINFIALGGYPGMMSSCFYLSGGMFLQVMTAFLISGIACLLAGTMREAILFDALFLGGPTAVIYCVGRMISKLVWGSPYGAVMYSGQKGGVSSLMKLTADFNPLIFFRSQLKKYSIFYRGLTRSEVDSISPHIIIMWTAAVCVLVLLAWLAFRARRAEQAGISGQNRILMAILTAVSGFCIFSIVFVMFADSSYLIALILAVLAEILLLVLWRAALAHSAEAGRLRWWAVNLAVVAAVFGGILLSGNLGAGSLPQTDDISSVKMTYTGSPSFITSQTSGTSTETSYYMVSSQVYSSKDSISAARGINERLVDMGRRKMGTAEKNFQATVVPYDVEISYRLKNGRVVDRYYDRASLGILEKMTGMDSAAENRNELSQLLTGTLDSGREVNWAENAYESGSIFLTNTWLDRPYSLSLSAGSRAQLCEALAGDLARQDMKDRYFPRRDALGVLLFTGEGEDDLYTFSWHLGSAPIYITGEFKNTLKFLRAHGWLKLLKPQAQVEGVYLQRYDPFAGINGRKEPLSNIFLAYRAKDNDSFMVQTDFGDRQAITDPARLAKILPNLRSTYCMTREGYLAAVKLEGEDHLVYKYLPGSAQAYR